MRRTRRAISREQLGIVPVKIALNQRQVSSSRAFPVFSDLKVQKEVLYFPPHPSTPESVRSRRSTLFERELVTNSERRPGKNKQLLQQA